jgi:hypothetical protein
LLVDRWRMPTSNFLQADFGGVGLCEGDFGPAIRRVPQDFTSRWPTSCLVSAELCDTLRPLLELILLYSANPGLAYAIQYDGGYHSVWCTPYFDPSSVPSINEGFAHQTPAAFR